MDYKEITDKQFVNAYRTAGLWFIALYMEVFIWQIESLENKKMKEELIERIYDNGENTFDKKIDDTRSRVNALIKIIKAKRIEEVLNLVVESKRINSIYAVDEAKKLLNKIENGELILP